MCAPHANRPPDRSHAEPLAQIPAVAAPFPNSVNELGLTRPNVFRTGVYGVGPVLHLESDELQLLLELLGFIRVPLSARRAQAGNHEKPILV